MTRLRQSLRESSILLAASIFLGLGYTALMQKGLFARATSSRGIEGASLQDAPAMVSAREAFELFESGRALFIDTRHEYDYRLGHIRGAVNIPLKEYDAMNRTLGGLQKDQTIVVYCDGAECNSSIEFAARLHSDGFLNVRIFFGGWREWQLHGYPVEPSTP